MKGNTVCYASPTFLESGLCVGGNISLEAGDQKIKKKKKYKITGTHDSLSYDPVAILKI